MIHNLDEVPKETLQPRPAVKLCHLILSECLKGGHPGIQLNGGGVYEAMQVLTVQFLIDGLWKDTMKIPVAAGVAVLAHFRSMCDVDPSGHPEQRGTFRVSASRHNASVAAHFTQSADGVDHAELQLSADRH